SGAFGLLGLLATGWLSTRFGLPEGLLRWASLLMLPWMVALGTTASRESISLVAVRAVIGVNLLWVAASLGLLLSGATSPTTLGAAFMLIQAAAVLLFAVLQYAGLRGER